MKSQPKLNTLSIWAAIPVDGMYSKKYISNRTYSIDNDYGVASVNKPIYAYAKNLKRSKLDFSLFMYSDSPNQETIEKFFNESVKSIKTELITEALVIASSNNFKYTDIKFKENE